MEKIDAQRAKTDFSRLLDRAQAGEAFLIAKAGKAVALLGPIPKMRILVNSQLPATQTLARCGEIARVVQ